MSPRRAVILQELFALLSRRFWGEMGEWTPRPYTKLCALCASVVNHP